MEDEVKSYLLEMGTDEDYPDLDRKIEEAIEKVDTWLEARFPNAIALDLYFSGCGREKSLDLLKNGWGDGGGGECPMHHLQHCMGDNLPLTIACGLVGDGRGLWEIFDEFPCLNTIV